MPIQYTFRNQRELAEYLDRLGKSARERGDSATAYGFEQAAMLVENAKFEGVETA
jgi:hypothetical protein